MRRLIALAGFAFVSGALAQAAEIQRAEQVGLELFQAYERAPAHSEAKAIAENANVERCGGPYRAVALSPKVVYLLAEPTSGVAVGRHFRIEIAGDGKAGSVVPSSRTCLLLAELPASASAGATRPARALLSHTLSPTPNEFHVFLSLKHDHPIYVMTRTGGWKVEAGLITRIN